MGAVKYINVTGTEVLTDAVTAGADIVVGGIVALQLH